MSKKGNYHLILRQHRLQVGLTQAQLAESIGEPQSYVSKYESAEQRLDLQELEKICNILNVPLLDLVREYLES
ncbi:MAG: helix-turn-helix domain-containing protein [Synergistaceae bacterium]|jgi:transcriptional regulator with XRE-family HTH domain|nr:helix-turn-helix domain-containing protein [Synergistaceae bacterium]